MNEFKIDINSIHGDTCGKFVSTGYGKHVVRSEPRWELIYVLKGSLYMFEEDQQFSLEEGEALILTQGKIHGSTREYSPDLQFYWFHFFCEQTDNDPLILPQHSKPDRKSRITQLLSDYVIEKYSEKSDATVCDLIAKLLLVEITNNAGQNQSPHNTLAVKIKNYIHTNISKRIQSSDIAKSLGYSSDYIERIFKKSFGHTITNEIRRTRINYCCQLLIHSTLTVSEIASVGGFSSVEDFCRVFKKERMLTPTEYRRKNVHDKINII